RLRAAAQKMTRRAPAGARGFSFRAHPDCGPAGFAPAQAREAGPHVLLGSWRALQTWTLQTWDPPLGGFVPTWWRGFRAPVPAASADARRDTARRGRRDRQSA